MADDIVFTLTQKALSNMAVALAKEAQNNLYKGRAAALNTSSGMIVLTPRTEGDKIIVDVQAPGYYNYINKGVRGTRGGSGLYAFKKDFPGYGMITALQSWMGARGIIPHAATVHKMAEANNSINRLSAAIAIGRAILRNGIQPTGFLDKAVQTVLQQNNDELVQAIKADIITSMQNNLE